METCLHILLELYALANMTSYNGNCSNEDRKVLCLFRDLIANTLSLIV